MNFHSVNCGSKILNSVADLIGHHRSWQVGLPLLVYRLVTEVKVKVNVDLYSALS